MNNQKNNTRLLIILVSFLIILNIGFFAFLYLGNQNHYQPTKLEKEVSHLAQIEKIEKLQEELAQKEAELKILENAEISKKIAVEGTESDNSNFDLNQNLEINSEEGNIDNSRDASQNKPTEELESPNIEPVLISDLPHKITVDWTEPQEVSFTDLFLENKIEKALKIVAANYEVIKFDDYIDRFKIYKVGTALDTNYDFYVLKVLPYGVPHDNIYRILVNDSDVVFLKKYSGFMPDMDLPLFRNYSDLEINNLEPEESINIPNYNSKLIKIQEKHFQFFLEMEENLKKVFTTPDNKIIYQDQSNCYLSKAKDHTMRNYNFSLDFLGEKSDDGDTCNNTPYLLDITWNDGQVNQNEYMVSDPNNYWIDCHHNVSYIDMLDLVQIGNTKNGDPIYELKDQNFTIPGEEKALLQKLYDEYYPGWDDQLEKAKEKLPYEEFIAGHPVIYWQDPFGVFVELRNALYMPAVEMGKPVIYLYPESEIDISVEVAPNNGFKITEPEYHDGWYVRANPQGEIYNYRDQKTYPYLFWEGYGLDYRMHDKGFVVARAELKSFLEEKLAQLGLVAHEYDEFIEFWLPRMQEKPYYFVTFMPQDDFEKLAPLDISPRPDTIIRVFMDYKGLDQFESVIEQEIITPERRGFTVVEWGGAMHD